MGIYHNFYKAVGLMKGKTNGEFVNTYVVHKITCRNFTILPIIIITIMLFTLHLGIKSCRGARECVHLCMYERLPSCNGPYAKIEAV